MNLTEVFSRPGEHRREAVQSPVAEMIQEQVGVVCLLVQLSALVHPVDKRSIRVHLEHTVSFIAKKCTLDPDYSSQKFSIHYRFHNLQIAYLTLMNEKLICLYLTQLSFMSNLNDET